PRHVRSVGTLLLNALEQRHDAAHVPRLRRADPIVVAALEPAPVVGERFGHAVDPLARGDVAARGRLNHRLAVLIHPHEIVHLVAAQPVVAGDAVRADLLQRVAEVRIAIRVIDGGREVDLLAPPHYNRSWSRATTRVSPASERSVTRSRKMSTEMTRSFPAAVFTVLPSFGKR